MNAASSFASTSTGQGSGLSQRGLVGIGVYTDAASGHSIVNVSFTKNPCVLLRKWHILIHIFLVSSLDCLHNIGYEIGE